MLVDFSGIEPSLNSLSEPHRGFWLLFTSQTTDLSRAKKELANLRVSRPIQPEERNRTGRGKVGGAGRGAEGGRAPSARARKRGAPGVDRPKLEGAFPSSREEELLRCGHDASDKRPACSNGLCVYNSPPERPLSKRVPLLRSWDLAWIALDLRS